MMVLLAFVMHRARVGAGPVQPARSPAHENIGSLLEGAR